MLKAIWNYRDFILFSIKNEIYNKFARSILGGLWIIINPLSQVLIYSIILSNVLSSKLPGIDSKYAYSIYLISGFLGWILFNDFLLQLTNIFTEKANFIKKNKFPRVTLPIISLGTNLVNNFVLFITIIMVLFFLKHPLSISILWLFPLTLSLAAFTLGIGLILGVFNTFIRDISQALPITLQVWFWFTPICYPKRILPEQFQSLLNLNPLAHYIESYHKIILYNLQPNLLTLFILSIISIVFLSLSFIIYKRSMSHILDIL